MMKRELKRHARQARNRGQELDRANTQHLSSEVAGATDASVADQPRLLRRWSVAELVARAVARPATDGATAH
jgi:hypothetical protein